VRRARHALWAALVLILIWGANFSVQKQVFNALSPGGSCSCATDHAAGGERAAAAASCTRWPKVPRAECSRAQARHAGHVLHVGLVTFGNPLVDAVLELADPRPAGRCSRC